MTEENLLQSVMHEMTDKPRYMFYWAEYRLHIAHAFNKSPGVHFGCCIIKLKDNRIMLASKLHLSACSNFFRDAFAQLSGNQEVMVRLTSITYTTMEYIVDYAYRGMTYVNAENLDDFMIAAQMLLVKGLAPKNPSDLPAVDAYAERTGIPVFVPNSACPFFGHKFQYK